MDTLTLPIQINKYSDNLKIILSLRTHLPVLCRWSKRLDTCLCCGVSDTFFVRRVCRSEIQRF